MIDREPGLRGTNILVELALVLGPNFLDGDAGGVHAGRQLPLLELADEHRLVSARHIRILFKAGRPGLLQQHLPGNHLFQQRLGIRQRAVVFQAPADFLLEVRHANLSRANLRQQRRIGGGRL